MSARNEPRWVDRLVVESVHLDLLREHGGMRGPPDEGALETALARPRHKWAYDEPDLSELAAAYGYALARTHPFADGNKRVAFVTMAVFLALNGLDLEADEEEVVAIMLLLAAGELEEAELAAWIREHVVFMRPQT
ncbi:MAG: type II toxin-antitoxin system death-on-curing family toxin [Thermoleophilia bacterium]